MAAYRMSIVKRAKTALERQVREAIEIARAPEGSLLNQKEEYNRCLLPTMTMVGPKSIRVQEREDNSRDQGRGLTQEQEEKALLEAKKALKAKLSKYKAERGPPSKRTKTTTKGSRPGYQLPPTWDTETTTCLEDLAPSDISKYLKPLRRVPIKTSQDQPRVQQQSGAGVDGGKLREKHPRDGGVLRDIKWYLEPLRREPPPSQDQPRVQHQSGGGGELQHESGVGGSGRDLYDEHQQDDVHTGEREEHLQDDVQPKQHQTEEQQLSDDGGGGGDLPGEHLPVDGVLRESRDEEDGGDMHDEHPQDDVHHGEHQPEEQPEGSEGGGDLSVHPGEHCEDQHQSEDGEGRGELRVQPGQHQSEEQQQSEDGGGGGDLHVEHQRDNGVLLKHTPMDDPGLCYVGGQHRTVEQIPD